ncbi:MAG TPA: hypothetical protein P5269_07520 [Syntrophales bacterium]|nr:hypothetical protein [Syntrophales bacterium]HON99846.1 hypothetical protein [Syntrophales bacterium]HPQ07136.1 hypothetical protein [Syntrophales bacterium]HRS87464.1 hypothetical protein [Syntrophales bacterium]HRV43324.1 hypothetical protein [Syntrophales bacterium]
MVSPPEIHLCQPGAEMSCGACCGLYNYADSSRESLAARLRGRTALYGAWGRTPEDLEAFAAEIRRREDGTKRYEVIYCCEYLGFLDREERRVGCLLHPCQNGGRDLRGVSFYGRELCDGHFCPSYHYLSREEKLALLMIIDDWYLWGLVVTDIDLVKAYFRLAAEAVSEMPKPAAFSDREVRGRAGDFFALKLNWPYRSDDVRRFGKYYFDGSQYMIRPIPYDRLHCDPSPFDGIFKSLTSEFRSREEIQRAEDLIRAHIASFREAYERWREKPLTAPASCS